MLRVHLDEVAFETENGQVDDILAHSMGRISMQALASAGTNWTTASTHGGRRQSWRLRIAYSPSAVTDYGIRRSNAGNTGTTTD